MTVPDALPVASNASANTAFPVAAPAAPDDSATMDVFVTVAVRTSDGPGPGVKTVPVAEGQWLIRQR